MGAELQETIALAPTLARHGVDAILLAHDLGLFDTRVTALALWDLSFAFLGQGVLLHFDVLVVLGRGRLGELVAGEWLALPCLRFRFERTGGMNSKPLEHALGHEQR